MKQVAVFILMMLHLNVALIPHLDEVDVYNVITGSQVDDINTVYEWVSIVLGIDTTADDEDDDNANDGQISFNFVTTCPRLVNHFDIRPNHNFGISKSQNFSTFITCQIKSISFDIESPPPEA